MGYRLMVPLLLALAGSAPAAAQPAAPPAVPGAMMTRVTISVEQVPLRQAVALVCGGARVLCVVDAGVPDTLIDLDVRDVPLGAALRKLVDAAAEKVPGLTLDADEERWVIRALPLTPRAARVGTPRTRVSLGTANKPLRAAIRELFRGMDVWCAVDPNVPDVPVTVNFRGVTLHSAVWLVAGAASARGPQLLVQREGENFAIRVRQPDPNARAASFVRGTGAAKRIDLDFNYVPLRRALKVLATDPSWRFVVEGEVPDANVKLRLRGLTPEAVVRQITGVAALQAPGVTYVRSGDVFVIYRQDAG